MTVLHQPHEVLTGTWRRDREARLLGALNDLLARRPDLHGVHAPADHAADATLWGV